MHAVMIGETISHYKIRDKLGGGGMGVVYRAEDMKLRRTVALKFLPGELTRDDEAKERFVHEAQAASALQHRNICTIHEIDETPDGRLFICMDCYDGVTLKEKIAGGALPVAEALDIAIQTAAGLSKAHEAGMVHRDVKPANIMVTKDGEVKILDFGLAKLAGRTKLTRTGSTLGTVAYMSPEQAMGKDVDTRSDIFSLGSVLYEMLAGALPFPGEHDAAIMYGIMNLEPEPLAKHRAGLPEELQRIVGKALAKDPAERYQSVRELERDLEAVRGEAPARALTPGLFRSLRQPRVLAIVAGVFVVAAAFAAWAIRKDSKMRWARDTVIPQAIKLADEDRYADAFALAGEAERYASRDSRLPGLLSRISRHVSIATTPQGAAISYTAYLEPNAEWIPIGRSPIDSLRLPLGGLRFRIESPGCETLECMGMNLYLRPESYECRRFAFELVEAGSKHAGMVNVPGADVSVEGLPGTVRLPAFLLDKHEVTNREYKRFIEADGYGNRAYWKNAFIDSGRVLSREEAMARFRDATGRQGPSTWQGGTYPEGQDDYPVAGVSWYEAAAYAEFAGKSLPTVHHWREAARASDNEIPSLIVQLSNFGYKGAVAVGSTHAIGPFGTCDMAGNVKEWCWNESGAFRQILGGAWDDPAYMYVDPDARPPFDRSSTNGFRCAVFPDSFPAVLASPVPLVSAMRDYSAETPVSDHVFQAYAAQYSYDAKPLDPVIESTDDSSPYWRKERVSYTAAYGNGRVPAYLFLPKNARGPFQAVVFMPGWSAWYPSSSENLRMINLIDFLVMSGRAVMYPIYEGTYERYTPDNDADPMTRRAVEWRIKVVTDCLRSIDYLQTRADIDSSRIAYYGYSFGARSGSMILALDDRLKAGVFACGGFSKYAKRPEIDELNFAPRVRVPVLMINGRYDLHFPLPLHEALFERLGTPPDRKKHEVFDMGHGFSTANRSQITKDVLAWFDTYLGPVR